MDALVQTSVGSNHQANGVQLHVSGSVHYKQTYPIYQQAKTRLKGVLKGFKDLFGT